MFGEAARYNSFSFSFWAFYHSTGSTLTLYKQKFNHSKFLRTLGTLRNQNHGEMHFLRTANLLYFMGVCWELSYLRTYDLFIYTPDIYRFYGLLIVSSTQDAFNGAFLYTATPFNKTSREEISGEMILLCTQLLAEQICGAERRHHILNMENICEIVDI